MIPDSGGLPSKRRRFKREYSGDSTALGNDYFSFLSGLVI